MQLIFAILLFVIAPVAPVDSPDALWDGMSSTVASGDFEGYAALYHEDAVLVNGLSGESYSISQALDGWKQGFDDTREGTMTASVEFRFTKRLENNTTAHHTGIFAYTAKIGDADPVTNLIHFEGLMVLKDGEWKLMMEYQKSVATPAEWEAAG